jgi:hypothetical protein
MANFDPDQPTPLLELQAALLAGEKPKELSIGTLDEFGRGVRPLESPADVRARTKET